MELLSKAKTGKVERPVKVLQFGEGNFLRAFVDYMIDIANESGDFNGDIVLVKPIEFGTLDRFHDQIETDIRLIQRFTGDLKNIIIKTEQDKNNGKRTVWIYKKT